jgi:N6-L-threonylcarbamoyladenine synthase
MIILSIETSCDETAISIVEADGAFPNATYTVLGNALFSQIDIHREFGGVFPVMAKREHIVTILPMLEKALDAASMRPTESAILSQAGADHIRTLLSREDGLSEQLIHFYQSFGKPPIDLIAVTSGPGLEPALWVGINFAKALSYLWNIPAVPVDHMEGHILASIFATHHLEMIQFPAMALLVSGGHTEFILMNDWGQYKKVGQTRDDAVGEAFDKVARLLGLPYPGGPEISRLATEARMQGLPVYTPLPQPMLHSGDLDLSFSGLKTAVRYAVQDKTLSDDEKQQVARDFEDAVVGVLVKKSIKAVEEYSILSLILGGGVSANSYLRHAILALQESDSFPDLQVYLPDVSLSTDNSIMIALAGHARAREAKNPEHFESDVRAEGNRSL